MSFAYQYSKHHTFNRYLISYFGIIWCTTSRSRDLIGAKYQGIPSMHSGISWKFKLTHFMKLNFTKIMKIDSSECGQDTLACWISGHSFHAFSWKCWETPDFTFFTNVLACETLKFGGWSWKRYILFPLTKWMFSGNFMTFEWNPQRCGPKKCDGQTDGQTWNVYIAASWI